MCVYIVYIDEPKKPDTTHCSHSATRRALKGAHCRPATPLQTYILKINIFLDTIIQNVLRDVIFGRNHSLDLLMTGKLGFWKVKGKDRKS